LAPVLFFVDATIARPSMDLFPADADRSPAVDSVADLLLSSRHFMAKERAHRRLAAILAADVVGFTRLMAADEAGTLAALKARRKEVLAPLVAKHQGRVFKVAGDGVLVEFASAVNAVECAVELQQAMASANRDVPEPQQIVLRVGVNLGDVIVEGSDLYGDGVNIAARLETIAKPGFIVISAMAFDYIKGKVRIAFQDLGLQALKNLAEPVHAYQVADMESTVERSSRPDKPSIAVLAFENMSGDPEQEYFGDGIAEDIITDLSKISTLAVAARNTSFALKGKAMDVIQMARQLGVTYVVEGSVRKAGHRARITAQLIDGRVGHHLWAERYDRELSDIFAVQDEISRAIVDALKIRLAPEERAGIGHRTTENVEAYQLYLMGRFYLRSQGRHSNRMAVDLFRRATQLDPNFARAWASLALAHSWLRMKGDPTTSLDLIEGFVSRALRLDEELAEAHAARAEVLLRHSDVVEAEAAARRAVELDPTMMYAHFALGEVLRRTNRLDEAARAFEAAIPLGDENWWPAAWTSLCHDQLGHRQVAQRLGWEAMKRLERAIGFDPENALAFSVGSFVLRLLGQQDRALEWMERSIEIDPDDHLAKYNAACFLLQVGEMDRAFDLLEICMPNLSRAQLDWMRRDPDLESVRDHPRYRALIQHEEERWRRAGR
jgi:adenylate cyclase